MPDITLNIKPLFQRLSRIAENCGRPADDIQILAASKTQNHEAIEAAYNAGLSAFGENYLQEALEKMDQLSHLDIEWHFIGPIQSNKTRAIAERFTWVHSVDRLKIAQRLSHQRPDSLPPLNICLQINIDDETSKSGMTAKEAQTIAPQVARLPKLRLRGLMAIPRAETSLEKQRPAFFRLRQLLGTLGSLSPELAQMDTLSMGMSADMEAAIVEGSTIVRIGTAIFGQRTTDPGDAKRMPAIESHAVDAANRYNE